MSGVTEKLVKVGLTPRMLLFSLGWCIFNTVFFGAALSIKNSDGYIPTFVLIMVEALIAKAVSSKYQFTPQEWAVFFAVAGSGLLTTTSIDGPDFRGNNGGMSRAFFRSFQEAYASHFEAWHISGIPVSSPLIVTDANAVQGFLYGGSIPWDLYAPVIAWNILALASLYLAFHFLSIVFRKPWIEQEKLNFPMQRPWIEVVKATHNMDSLALIPGTSFWNPLKNKWFWTGFIMAFIFMLPDLSEIYFGNNWFTGYVIGGVTYVRHRYQRFIISPVNRFIDPYWMQDFLPGTFEFTLYIMAANVLMPMDILYSAFIYKLVQGIGLFGINYYSGSTTNRGSPEGETNGLIRYRVMFDAGNQSIPAAIFVAIPLVLIWKARNNIVRSLKGIVSGAKDEGEAHSWRIVWLGFFGFLALWWVTMFAAGALWWYCIAVSGTMTLLFIFQTRALSETVFSNYVQTPNIAYHSLSSMMLEPAGALVNNPATQTALVWNHSIFSWEGFQAPMSMSMTGFKYGHELNANARDISLAIIIATVVGIVVAVPTAIWTYYYMGASVIYSRVLELRGIATSTWQKYYIMAQQGTTVEKFYGFDLTNWGGWFAAGLVSIFVIEYLRTTWAWFFFNPMGIVVATCGLWSYNLWIAFAIKWLGLRFLGGKRYEHVITAMMCGILIGYVFSFMFGMLSTTLWGL